MPKKIPLRERFYGRTSPGENGCLIWTGSELGGGYGGFSIGGQTVYAHRVAWELERGPLEKGRRMTLDHLCRDRRCVNVEHLELVTFRENVVRGVGPTARNEAKDACIHGHPFSGSNLVTRKSGDRDCRECLRRRVREYQRRRRATGRAGPVVLASPGGVESAPHS